MMDLLNNLALGFGVVNQIVWYNLGAFSIPVPINIVLCLIGALVGTLVGVLPGVGPLATIAMLLPITFGLPPVGALIMLAGIYYGAQYGGSTTSILVNIPGEASSVVTTLDGHQMAKQGRAGPALAIAAIGSFFAGSRCDHPRRGARRAADRARAQIRSGGIFLADGARPGLRRRAGEGLGAESHHHDPVRAVAVDGRVGPRNRRRRAWRSIFRNSPTASASSPSRWACSASPRSSAISKGRTIATIVNAKITGLMPTMKDLKDCVGPIGRGTVLGSILGILPGGGAVIAAFAAYTFEKKISKTPQMFGRGAIEGVAAPESANNAAAQTSFIPLLTLGIPPNAVMALMVGAMTIHGIVPGPQVMTKQPELFWGMIASMWIGNLMLLVINLPLVGLWVRLLRVPYRMLYPAILIFCCIGVYSLNNAPVDVMMTAAFGLIGYWLIKHDFEPAPMLLGFVLGPLMEENLRRAMLIAARRLRRCSSPGRSPARCWCSR